MDGKALRLMVALTGALTLAVAACGPGRNNDQAPKRGSVPTAPAQFPPQVAPASQPATGAGTGTYGAGATFVEAAGSKGYITRQEANRVPRLENDFAQCDTNRDGRITRAEYDQCRGRLAQPGIG